MTLRYSRTLTVSALVVGLLLLALSLATGEVLSIITGAILAVLGGLLMRTPIAVLADGDLQRKNALGMTLKRFPVAGPTDLRLEGNKVVHVPTGKTAVAIGFGVDRTDAAAWRSWIGGAQQ